MQRGDATWLWEILPQTAIATLPCGSKTGSPTTNGLAKTILLKLTAFFQQALRVTDYCTPSKQVFFRTQQIRRGNSHRRPMLPIVRDFGSNVVATKGFRATPIEESWQDSAVERPAHINLKSCARFGGRLGLRDLIKTVCIFRHVRPSRDALKIEDISGNPTMWEVRSSEFKKEVLPEYQF